MPTARFDDLRPRRRRSFALGEPTDVLVAHRHDDVTAVIEQAEAAVRNGCWVAGWIAYEAAPGFDPALRVRDTAGTQVEGLPLAWFSVFRRRRPASPPEGDYRLGRWKPSITPARHARDVEAIRERIRAGDTYQVNHTMRLVAEFSGEPEGLYGDLCASQNTAYGALLDAGRWAVVSVSPELFFEWSNGRLTTRPMKGTAPRGVDLAADECRRKWLEGSEKNRAENLMIVDMVRNDLGRVARTGTVEVPALFTTEKYDTVWQLTSTVAAEPRPGLRLAEALAALFPSASITGAPKVSTMGIIADLEPDPRGVYCGAVGFGGPTPDGEPHWVFNVGIRTVLVDRANRRAIYGTGGGITYDSTPADEHREALLKAEVLARRSADFRLLETIRWGPAEGFRHLDRHLDRLASTAAYFDVPLDPAEARTALERAVDGATAGRRLRLLVDRTGWIEVETGPLAPARNAPLRLALDTVPVDSGDPFLHHKTTNRRVYEEALARHPGVDDVVLVNRDGQVTETTVGNLAVLAGGRWLTPPTDAGCLAGTERAALLAAGTLAEHPLAVSDLLAAEGVARVNSVRGWEEAVVVSSVRNGASPPAGAPSRSGDAS